MSSQSQITMVERYFTAVDAQDLQGVLGVLTPDCVFCVETHGVVLRGRDEIAGMFRRLWNNHRAVRHHDFVHVPSVDGIRIASQFQVENTESDGSVTRKSNCNFFDLKGTRFSKISVYMAGVNTLEGA